MNQATIDSLRQEASAKLDPDRRAKLGQFLTPFRIAEFMANMFERRDGAVLLDAGAGIGSLTLAASKALQIERIEAWEIDPVMLGYLETHLANLGIAYEIHQTDFIVDSIDRVQFDHGTRFTHAILNPPYKKIGTHSIHRAACSSVGLDTVNLYTAFLAFAILQMRNGGEIVAIVPRSFCNGPYYRPFREMLLVKCSIDAIHVFDSRNTAFGDDDVLQENIIIHLTRGKTQGKVMLSFSNDASFGRLHCREASFSEIVQAGDMEKFIRIPKNASATGTQSRFTHSLTQLGIEVCTGPVVDFRLREWWITSPQPGTAPLLYPHHFSIGRLQWPKEHKKPNALVRGPEVDKWLMPNGVYVIVKRFSAKEERRRVVAYLLTPEDIDADRIGFENHWNVFHVRKNSLPLDIAKGLACFLNSTELDEHFRIFSGHTQVNATDLRNMNYPSPDELRRIGAIYRPEMSQTEIDQTVTEQ